MDFQEPGVLTIFIRIAGPAPGSRRLPSGGLAKSSGSYLLVAGRGAMSVGSRNTEHQKKEMK